MREKGPTQNRIAAVLSARRQGSGYLIASNLILTAAHVLVNHDDVRVAIPGQRGEIRCDVVWERKDQFCDAALISPKSGSSATHSSVHPVRLGVYRDSLDPIPNCQVIGFPKVQRSHTGRLDTEQFIGTLKPGSKLLSARYSLDSSHNPPERQLGDSSPWAGFSGAAVFSQDLLLGVVAHDPSGWRHGRLDVTPARILESDPEFRKALELAGVLLPFVVLDSADSLEYTKFENRYREYVLSKYGTLTIFGIDLSDRSNAEWPLDGAYLSLEAVRAEKLVENPAVDGPVTKAPGQVQSADQALAGHQRVLLRGVAGSGKTTLVQWLAVSAAKQELGENLRHLYNRVPVVLPLRTLMRHGELPMPDSFLAAIRSPLASLQPVGWIESVLSGKRGLMLVDGIDEISEREREHVREWLRDLMLAFPGNMWLVTSRPSAVTDSWLAKDGFVELSLSAMGRSEISAFVQRWHNAAISNCQDEEEIRRLEMYRSVLVTAIRTKQDLGRLATNPLMCGLICALHRDRRGYLPAGRKQLYDAALSMLLARRDRERDLDVCLPEEPQIQLLQKLAYWLIKNGQVEMDRFDAIDLITAALPAIPSIADLGEPSRIYNFLLLRSGLIREPVPGVVDFIHRTFQDYLGAKAVVEERDFDLMVRNAHHDQWEDVIRMAVAHAYPVERARILNKLLKRGDRVKKHRTRLHLLAMACLEHATELEVSVRGAVEERAAMLIPPENSRSADALASAGLMVLDLLPGPESLTDAQAEAVARTATLIGSDAALPVLVKFRDSKNANVQDTLVRAWRTFDSGQYGREVIAHLPKDLLYWAYSIEQLEFLKDVGGRDRVILTGHASAGRLSSAFPVDRLKTLGLHNNKDFEDFIEAPMPRLEALHLYRCPKVIDISPLRSSAGLEKLTINEMKGLMELQGLEVLDSLTYLSIAQPMAQSALMMLPSSGKLRSLTLSDGAVESTALQGLRRCVSLESLTLRCGEPDAPPVVVWGEVCEPPRLTRLRLDRFALEASLDSPCKFPKIKELALIFGKSADLIEQGPRRIVETFPEVRKISGYWTSAEIEEMSAIFPDAKVTTLIPETHRV